MTGMRRDGAERATSRLLVVDGRCEWKVILRKARGGRDRQIDNQQSEFSLVFTRYNHAHAAYHGRRYESNCLICTDTETQCVSK